MFALVSPESIQLPAGAVVRLPATWSEYQRLCEQRGDGTLPRLKYRPGEVLLMAPLPGHGRDANLIADIVKALLDHREQDYDAFTPVTMTLPEISGLEPDYCFYIQNWQAISGKTLIDWQQDPPPDLVIEVDVTSFSDVQDYLPFRVPEIWLYKQQQLLMYQFQPEGYQRVSHSQFFPDFDLPGILTRCVQIAYDRNSSAAIRDLKQWLVAQG